MEAVADEGKARAWRERIEAQRASGQSIRAWCRASGTREPAFYWWRARLGLHTRPRRRRRAGGPAGIEPAATSFARVKVIGPPATEPLCLRLAGGRELILPASMPPEQVAQLLRALEGVA